MEGKYTPDCRYGACVRCGACPSLCGEDVPGEAAQIKPRVNLPEPEWAGSLRQAEEAAQSQTGDAPGSPDGGASSPDSQIPGVPQPPRLREDLTRREAHYRVWFSKTGPAAYLSQLELGNVLERALRRSGLKPSFSAGYHPLPLVSFGWALPVGVESQREWFALFLREAASPAEVVSRLDAALPDGLDVLEAETLGMGKKVPQPVAEEFLLRYQCPPEQTARHMEQWRAFLAQEHFPWYSVTKKGARTVDIRPLVDACEEKGPDTLRLTFRWEGNRYVSPLKLVGAVNEGLALTGYALTKLRQIFA
uniref:DUF2344 domain-containing protein n=1 Tax=Fundidesulfovibrio putealis TaxID=270496 RepID=A0A7C4EIK4_9BACT